MIILVAVAVVAASAPLAVVVLVSLAIRREDSAGSLSRGPSGAMEAIARRLLGFHGDGLTRPPARGRAPRRRLVAGGLPAHGQHGDGDDLSFLADQTDLPTLVA